MASNCFHNILKFRLTYISLCNVPSKISNGNFKYRENIFIIQQTSTMKNFIKVLYNLAPKGALE